jgi:hypothetical protein
MENKEKVTKDTQGTDRQLKGGKKGEGEKKEGKKKKGEKKRGRRNGKPPAGSSEAVE